MFLGVNRGGIQSVLLYPLFALFYFLFIIFLSISTTPSEFIETNLEDTNEVKSFILVYSISTTPCTVSLRSFVFLFLSVGFGFIPFITALPASLPMPSPSSPSSPSLQSSSPSPSSLSSPPFPCSQVLFVLIISSSPHPHPPTLSSSPLPPLRCDAPSFYRSPGPATSHLPTRSPPVNGHRKLQRKESLFTLYYHISTKDS